jgi:hypothetical protein
VAHRLIDQLGESIGSLDARVVLEIESRCVTQAESTPDFAAQEARSTPQTLRDLLGRVTITKRDE